MSTVEAIEVAIQNLAPDELARFRDWFMRFDADVWDARIETDAATGVLDALAAEALMEHPATFEKGA